MIDPAITAWLAITAIVGGFTLCGANLKEKQWLNALAMFAIGASNIAFLVRAIANLAALGRI